MADVSRRGWKGLGIVGGSQEEVVSGITVQPTQLQPAPSFLEDEWLTGQLSPSPLSSFLCPAGTFLCHCRNVVPKASLSHVKSIFIHQSWLTQHLPASSFVIQNQLGKRFVILPCFEDLSFGSFVNSTSLIFHPAHFRTANHQRCSRNWHALFRSWS